jgi:hypothetical protein
VPITVASRGQHNVTIRLTAADVALWWPNGVNPAAPDALPALHNITVTMCVDPRLFVNSTTLFYCALSRLPRLICSASLVVCVCLCMRVCVCVCVCVCVYPQLLTDSEGCSHSPSYLRFTTKHALLRYAAPSIEANADAADVAVAEVGFRTFEFVGSSGNSTPTVAGTNASLFFRVNGHAVFAKGHNWMPSFVLPADTETDRASKASLLSAARRVHANTIRVWGGGVYESDAFYEAADRLGLMVLQVSETPPPPPSPPPPPQPPTNPTCVESYMLFQLDSSSTTECQVSPTH